MNIYFKLKQPFTLESKFTTAYLKEFKQNDGWVFKIPDIVRTIKPFDFFAVNINGVYFCEVKMMESNVFKFSQLRNNQYTALKRISILVDKYFLRNVYPIVIVYSKKYDSYKIVNFEDILEAEKSGKEEIKFLF